MATHESTNLSDLATRVQQIAAQMAGFKPTLDNHQENVDKPIGDSLAMLAGMAEYVGAELGMIGERLATITPNSNT